MGSVVKLEAVFGANRLDISDIQNYVWEGQAGFGLAALHRQIVRGPQQHGSTDIGYLLDPRLIQLTTRIMGTGVDDMYAKLNALIAFFGPQTVPLSLCFTHLLTSVQSQIDVFTVGGLDGATPQRQGFTIQEMIQLYANDPTFYDPTPGYLGFSLGGGGGAWAIPWAIPWAIGASTINTSHPINYQGTADSYPWLTITGPATNPVITFSDASNSQKLDFTGVTIAGGDTRVIDTRYPYKTVVDASGTNKNGDLTTDSNLATIKINKLLPGESAHSTSVTVVASGINAVTRIDINYYNRFVAAR